LYLGSDGREHESVLKEALYLVNLGVFTPAEALQRLSHDTPRMIFPRRRIGVLAPGHEASFVTMSANPLEDISAILSLEDRVKQGRGVPAPDRAPNEQQ
jgi:imidazolonepropionase-like amidohydrolase